MSKADNRFYLIDSFRGLASLWILALHVLPSYVSDNAWFVSFIEFGRIGTDFFFVASGYASAIACTKILNGGRHNGFTIKRVKKIYSIYLYSLFLAIFLIPLLMALVSYLKSHQLIVEFAIPTRSDFLLYISLAKVFTNETWALNRAFVEINGVYWFIAVMIQIYIFLGIALRFKNGFYLIISAVSVLSFLCLIDSIKSLLPIGLFIPHFSKFFIGMCLYFFIRHRQQVNLPLGLTLTAAFAGLSSLVLYCHTNGYTGDYYRVISAITVSLLLYLIYPLDKKINRTVFGKVTLWLGSFSYSTYLNHVIFWPFMYMFVSNLVPLPLSLSAPLVLVPLIILCCYITHRAFDDPGLVCIVRKAKNTVSMFRHSRND